MTLHITKLYLIILLTVPVSLKSQVRDSIILERLTEIRKELDTMLFVKRSESVELPCVCIDSSDYTKAHTYRKITNSNYRIRLKNKTNEIDSGVQCLSNYYARYLRLKTTVINDSTMQLNGLIESSYHYPVSSIIQYLGFSKSAANATQSFFEKLLTAKGTFTIYPENDKYKIAVSLETGPYNKMDTIYGYMEIVREAYRSQHAVSYSFYFDQLNIHTGDRNNQISMRFSSTNFNLESSYYANMLYSNLKFINDPDKAKRAKAIWLTSFYANPSCTQCAYIYNLALFMVNKNVFSLPNTEPIPAH